MFIVYKNSVLTISFPLWSNGAWLATGFVLKNVLFGTFRYAFSPSGIYQVPDEVDHTSCLQYIRSLPIYPSPEVFGLHDNADITKDNKETEEVQYDLPANDICVHSYI